MKLKYGFGKDVGCLGLVVGVSITTCACSGFFDDEVSVACEADERGLLAGDRAGVVFGFDDDAAWVR